MFLLIYKNNKTKEKHSKRVFLYIFLIKFINNFNYF